MTCKIVKESPHSHSFVMTTSMKTIQVTITKEKQTYPIHIGNDILKQLTKLVDITRYTKLFVLTDEAVAPLFLKKLLAQLPKGTPSFVLPSGEKTKQIESTQQIWTALYKEGLDRKSLVINLGGGVITDMGGFAASTYMRGIAFLNIPTTLLAQVDASIGGKTGVDFDGIKNLIGTFTQPTGVIIDTQTLTTLPKRALISGFAEIIKHGLIAENAYFKKVTAKKPTEYSPDELAGIIVGSCEIKKQIIEKDTKEKGLRKIVNFGHTIGHAIEALSLETDNSLLHGEAVAIGMVAEAKIAEQLNLLTEKDVKLIEEKLTFAGLPTTIPNFPTDEILAKMHSDKKNEGGEIRFTLLKQIGEGVINQTVPTEIITRVMTPV